MSLCLGGVWSCGGQRGAVLLREGAGASAGRPRGSLHSGIGGTQQWAAQSIGMVVIVAPTQP